MSDRRVRILTGVVAVALMVVLSLNVWSRVRVDKVEKATGTTNSFSVEQAIFSQPQRRVAVEGFVFDDGIGVRLCQNREPGSPPTCIGPWLDLKRFDSSRVQLARTAEIVYSVEKVRLAGEVTGTEFAVDDVLPRE